MRRGLLALLAVLAGLLLSATAVYAAGSFTHYPPEMYTGNHPGRLSGMEWHWWNTYEDHWITGRVLREPTDVGYPYPARVVGKNEGVEIIIRSPEKPDKVYVKSYRNRELTGEAKVLHSYLLPIKTNGLHGRVVAWDLTFTLGRPGQQYVTAFAKWDQTPGRHYSYGWERRQFQFKTR